MTGLCSWRWETLVTHSGAAGVGVLPSVNCALPGGLGLVGDQVFSAELL